ncbi:MAG: oligosaccharide flippase family protein [Nitrososphaera sp.]
MFISSITLAAGGFVFWLVASQLMPVEEIGYATAAISSISVISSLSALGLEFTLLKRVSEERGKIVGTLFTFEVIANLALLPMVFLIANPLGSEQGVMILVLAASIFVANGIAFIPKSAMLGMMDAKVVIIYDTAAFAARFATLVAFALLDFGAIAILLSLLVHSAILSVVFGITTFRKLGYSLGSMSYLKTILRQGMSNFPTRLSRLIVTNLGVLLFAYVSLDPTVVGVFYIAVMFSIVGSEFATTLSTMAIPASLTRGKEIVVYSTKLGLMLGAPVVALLLSVPEFLLGLLGKSYSQGGMSLFLLSLAIIPTTLVLNGLAKFNAEGKFRMAAIMGLIEISLFLVLFFPLESLYSIEGVALAILVSYIASGGFAAWAFGRHVIGMTLVASLATALGYLSAYASGYVLDHISLKIALSLTVPLAVSIGLRAITVREIKEIASQLLAKSRQ